MSTPLHTKFSATFFASVILLIGPQAMAFSPPKSAVDACIDALEQVYDIQEQELGLEQVRAKPIGTNTAVIYLHTVAKPELEQPRERLYCTIDQNGSVMQLRTANADLRAAQKLSAK